MNQDAFDCNPARIDDYLDDRLDELEESALARHLDHCQQCQAQIASRAVQEDTWDEAARFLKDEPYDTIHLGSEVGWLEDQAQRPLEDVQVTSVLSTLDPTDHPHMLGRWKGYEISGVVGAGSMGVVLKAWDPALDRTVAIKVMAPHLASSGAARRRFAREAKAAAAVLHPNVIAIHGVSNEAPLPYLVMPYIRGESLQRRLDEHGPLATFEILRIGQQVAAGLAAAHAQGLVHRDIKPANILLADGVERVAITDFGLARAVDDATMTRSGVIAGTPQYMSPEQARGESIDARSDLFSLGSLLYVMATGHPPFRAETCFGVLRRITDDTPRSIQEINNDVPYWLNQLVQRLHAKDPVQRFQSAEEVEHLLRGCISHLGQPEQQPLPEPLAAHETVTRTPGMRWLVLWPMVLMAAGFTLWRIAPTTPNSSPMESSPSAVASSPEGGAATVGKASEAPTEHVGDLMSEPVWEDGLGEAIRATGAAIDVLDEETKAIYEPFGEQKD